jgi:Domain of unknown function (DUF4062)
MQPRFQVFLSSTFRDLRDERQAALEAILELGHFPAGMEAFPAADATPWELIKTIIADSDYYVLIVGGKYGSTGPEGISYTEMEFNLAEELKKPVLAFIHGDPDQIPAGKIELDPESRRRLQAFRERVTQRICKTWTNKENLKAAVLLALVHAIRTKPAFGWVRNEGLENQELLRRLASLQDRFDTQQTELQSLRASAGSLADTKRFRGLDSPIEVAFKLGTDKTVHQATVQLSDIFFGCADEMLVPCTEYRLRTTMKAAVMAALSADSVAAYTRYSSSGKEEWLKSNLDVEIDSMGSVLRQFLAIGLIEPEMVLRQSGDQKGTSTVSQRCWVLTVAGRAKYLEKRALPSDA